MEKQCFKCGEVKPLGMFYRHPGMSDGRLNKCKECAKRDVRKHREENESVREYDRRRSKTAKRQRHIKRNAKRWARRHPERRAANVALNNAVRDGRVFKPDICSLCKRETPSRSLHGHHSDYSKPLDVEWLCARCHASYLKKDAE